MSDTTEERREQLKLVSLGCNEDCHAWFEATFHDNGIYTWSLNEYLALRPIILGADLANKEATKLFQPFMERRLETCPFLPKWQTSLAYNEVLTLPMVPNTESVRDEYREQDGKSAYQLELTNVGKELFNAWTTAKGAEPFPYYRETATKELLKPKPSKEDATVVKDASELLEYFLTDYFWVHGGKDGLACDVLAVLIASKLHFYGYLVVQSPVQTTVMSGNTTTDPSWVVRTQEGQATAKPDLTPLGRELIKYLQDCARKRYLPVLALCHNRLAERSLDKDLDNGSGTVSSRVESACPFKDASKPREEPKDGDPADSSKSAVKPKDGDIDKILLWLWQERLDYCKSHKGEAADLVKELKKSLGFKDYGVASESMLRVVEQLLTFRFKHEPSPTKLESILIVGGPGSGKDDVAKLVSILSEGYTFGPVSTFNMAAIRPQALIGTALQGMAPFATGSALEGYQVLSILLGSGKADAARTVILDELNSMHIDQQGVLLRILENAQITPLLSGQVPVQVNFLCVGVMNEDPEDLMKEDEVRDKLTKSPLFGKILGTLGEELFWRARRLRPDLYYRMQRAGVLKLPSLGERHHDVPLLFYISCVKSKVFIDAGFCVEFAAYRELMKKKYSWPGNIRQLQAVTEEICRKAKEAGQLQYDNKVKITQSIVRKVLHERFGHAASAHTASQ